MATWVYSKAYEGFGKEKARRGCLVPMATQTNKEATIMNNKQSKIKTEQEIAKMRKQGARTLAGVMSIATLVTPVAGSLALSGCENETSNNPGNSGDPKELFSVNKFRIYNDSDQSNSYFDETKFYDDSLLTCVKAFWTEISNMNSYKPKIDNFKTDDFSIEININKTAIAGEYSLDKSAKKLSIFINIAWFTLDDMMPSNIGAHIISSIIAAHADLISMAPMSLQKLASAKGIATPGQRRSAWHPFKLT